MLKERSIFGDDNSVLQIFGDVVESNHAPLRTFTTGNGTNQLRFELRTIEMCPGVFVSDGCDRFSIARELNPQRLKRLRMIEHGIVTRLDLDRRTVDCVTPASRVGLLTA